MCSKPESESKVFAAHTLAPTKFRGSRLMNNVTVYIHVRHVRCAHALRPRAGIFGPSTGRTSCSPYGDSGTPLFNLYNYCTYARVPAQGMYFRPQYWADFLRGFVARHGATGLRPSAHRIALAVKRGRREVIRARDWGDGRGVYMCVSSGASLPPFNHLVSTYNGAVIGTIDSERHACQSHGGAHVQKCMRAHMYVFTKFVHMRRSSTSPPRGPRWSPASPPWRSTCSKIWPRCR